MRTQIEKALKNGLKSITNELPTRKCARDECSHWRVNQTILDELGERSVMGEPGNIHALHPKKRMRIAFIRNAKSNKIIIEFRFTL